MSALESGPVFENSAACVYVETSACWSNTDRNVEAQDPSPTNVVGDTLSTGSKRRLPAMLASLPHEPATIFTESLILAQDERWRRA